MFLHYFARRIISTYLFVAGLLLLYKKRVHVFAASEVCPGDVMPKLPTYTTEDVQNHNSIPNRIWVTYKNGVYDITDYTTQHPGGNKILLAAGSSIEPFWELYASHQVSEVHDILEGFRIGNYKCTDTAKQSDKAGPYAKDPTRHPALKPSSEKPFNGEPPPNLLVDNFITPNEFFFVRNHMPVPNVDLKTYSLEVLSVSSKGRINLSLADLKSKYDKITITATLQCAGNRRSEMSAIKTVKGLFWGKSAISNATWGGVRLSDVLKTAGISLQNANCKHIVFEGMDKGPEGAPYGASVPIDLALLLEHDILLAYEMNGRDIPADHGYPLRVIIPGVVGARQVKWLNKIYLSDEESSCHWQQNDYKGFSPSVDWHNVDFTQSVAIQQLPVQSAICEPENGETLESDSEEVTIRGYAWSGGGRAIVRVDVSADQGKTWHVAELQSPKQSLYRTWAWTLWETTIPLPADRQGQSVELICKAVDSSYNVQPDNVDGIWNLRGVLSNAWHRVTVNAPKGEQVSVNT